MNTAVSLDINIFREAEREAGYLHISVPEFCSLAIKEFLKNKNKGTVKEQLDNYYSENKAVIDEDIQQAQYDLMGKEDWEW